MSESPTKSSKTDKALAGPHHMPFLLLMTWLMAIGIVAFLLGFTGEAVFTSLVFIQVFLYLAVTMVHLKKR